MANLEEAGEQLFAEALDLPPERRTAFLDQACHDDPTLRRRVDALLRDHAQLGSFLDQPLLSANDRSTPATANIVPAAARFQAGQRIANRFLVVRFIARGGMGEVYEVKDELLQDAGVALKIIRPEIAGDEATSTRFKQEVILARKVVHPNLCPIYEISYCEQPHPPFLFLTMKLLQGKTLEARLRAIPLPASLEALEICHQLLAGVAALHAAGIIHRDLKPNNVMLDGEGEGLNVSIMDFGLARLHLAESSIVGTNMIAGTPGYMAPELLRGERPTRATDLYALGVVMHQVLTGTRPAESERGLTVTPSPSLRSLHAPEQLLQTVERFLAPTPEPRIAAFERVRSDNASRSTPTGFLRSSAFRVKTFWYAGIAAGAMAGLGIAIWLTPAPVSGPLESTQITFSAQPKEGPLFTDGARLYFESAGVPSEMATRGGLIVPMPQVAAGMRLMDISADGARVLEWKPVVGDETRRGSLYVASSLGGAPQKLGNFLVNTPDFGAAAWSPDAQSIAFTNLKTLYSVDADGSNLRKLWQAPLAVDGVRFPQSGAEFTVSLWASTIPSRLWRVKANGEGAHALVADWPKEAEQWSPHWTPDGRHFTFLSDREGRPNVYELVAPRWFEFWKKPMPVRITGNQVPILAAAPARDSKSLFVMQRMEQGAMQVWDPQSRRMEPFLGGLAANGFVISPDRRWMVYTEWPTGYLWRSRIDGSEPVQLTNTVGFMESWSPDSQWLVYSDGHTLFRLAAEGGTPEPLIPVNEPKERLTWSKFTPTWTPDGKSISFSYYNFTDQPTDGIVLLDLASRKLSLMPNTRGLYTPSWSPDGRRIAAIAQKRMMLYSTETKAWTELTQFASPWGSWKWSSDGASIYMALVHGQNGIYRITVPNGKWEKVTGLGGGYGDMSVGDAELSITADDQPAMMSRTGVAQIFQLHWKQ